MLMRVYKNTKSFFLLKSIVAFQIPFNPEEVAFIRIDLRHVDIRAFDRCNRP